MGRGLEWPQCLNCLFDCSLIVCLSANFLIFLLLILLSVVLSPLLLARSPEYPQRIRVVSVFEFFVCLIVLCLCVSKFSNFFLFHPPLFIQYSTEECSTVQLLARDPEYPQRIRVASVFEFCVCLSVCSLCVSKFSNWPATPSIHRGLEWPQCLNSVFGLWYTSISISISISMYPYPYIQRSYGHTVILPSQIYKRV